MGQMCFYTPTPEDLPPSAVDLAYITGLEAIPWCSRNVLTDNVLTIDRDVAESGNLHIPWNIEGIGDRVLSTCTLMERDEPYCLSTELARGTIYRARSLVADMESAGRKVPDSASELLHEALADFITAMLEPAMAQLPARRAIVRASQAIETLAMHNVAATLEHPPAASGNRFPTLLIGPASNDPSSLPDELTDLFVEAFHAVNVPFRWCDIQPTSTSFDWSMPTKQLDWCRTRRLRTIGGPLIQLDRLSLPEWVYSLHDNYEQFELAVVHYVRSTVQQFDGQVGIWVCAGRLNVPNAIAFSEEQKLRLAVATLEAVHSIAPRTPVAIGFDQPWAEYMVSADFDLSPLHFADALVRADLGVAGVAIEMNMGFWPDGTRPRDLLAISRHLDRWSLLGIPLLVYLSLPSGIGPDARATGRAVVVPRSADQLDVPAIDQTLAGDIVRLLISKPAVHGIVWKQWTDANLHEFPHAGLLDVDNHPKPLLETFTDIRKQYLVS